MGIRPVLCAVPQSPTGTIMAKKRPSRPRPSAKRSAAGRKAAPRKTSRKSAAKSVKSARKSARAAKPAAARRGKWVYTFGDGKAEGKAGLRDLLGGKGANLGEMANLGLPVPPGFTITTEVCTYFYAHKKTYPETLRPQVEAALVHVGKLTGKSFGDP